VLLLLLLLLLSHCCSQNMLIVYASSCFSSGRLLAPCLTFAWNQYSAHSGTYTLHGSGVYRNVDEDIILDGHWSQNHFNGQGKLYLPDGMVISGMWKNSDLRTYCQIQTPAKFVKGPYAIHRDIVHLETQLSKMGLDTEQLKGDQATDALVHGRIEGFKMKCDGCYNGGANGNCVVDMNGVASFSGSFSHGLFDGVDGELVLGSGAVFKVQGKLRQLPNKDPDVWGPYSKAFRGSIALVRNAPMAHRAPDTIVGLAGQRVDVVCDSALVCTFDWLDQAMRTLHPRMVPKHDRTGVLVPNAALWLVWHNLLKFQAYVASEAAAYFPVHIHELKHGESEL
jgi:hypothetical protein